MYKRLPSVLVQYQPVAHITPCTAAVTDSLHVNSDLPKETTGNSQAKQVEVEGRKNVNGQTESCCTESGHLFIYSNIVEAHHYTHCKFETLILEQIM